ncbi:MAG: hypothetical protein O7B29_15625 [Deltaproteobacteria bacterium]|nr:hypothetical protein [Deltaproteobacteria bacterium]
MEASDSQRMARARRAYEWGRVRFALRVTGYILPLVVVSLAACAVPERTIATGILLLLVAVGMRWRGGVYGRAMTPGLLAGLGAFAAPLLASAIESLSGATLGSILGPAYFIGGAVTGCVVGLRASRLETDEGRFLLSAGLVAALTGSLGCVLGGAGGVLGMLLGLVVATPPVYWLVRARA